MEWLYAQGIPIEAQYLYRKAQEMSRTGRDESALKYLKQAVIIAPSYSKAFYEMGNCLEKLGRHCEAFEKYNYVARIDPAFVMPARKKEDLQRRE